jgi:hypothetical protein
MRSWADTVLRAVPVALVAAVMQAPLASGATSPATYLSGRTFQCWQATGGDRVSRGEVAFATDYVPRYLRAGRQGAFVATATGVRFTSGPFLRPVRRVGDVHPDGIAMPRDRRRGARYQLVLRPARGARAAAWYCQDVS